MADTKSRAGGRTGSMWWNGALSNLPGLVVHPIDGEGCSHTLHWNLPLAISHNLEQDKSENAVEGASSNEPTLVSQEEDALPADHPT